MLLPLYGEIKIFNSAARHTSTTAELFSRFLSDYSHIQ